MSSKRRNKTDTDHKSDATSSATESKPVRSAWRATWTGNTHIVVQSRPFSTIAGIFLVLYSSIFALVRFDTIGLTPLLYWSNAAVMVGGAGLLLHSGLLIGLSIAQVSASHMTFIYDLISWLLFDRFPLGRAAYLEEETDFWLWFTSLHQFWFLPLICCIIYCEYSGQLRLMKRYWFFGCILNFLLAIMAKTHFEEQRLVLGQPFTFVPDFVLGHEMWTEELTLLHSYDHLPTLIYATWSSLLSSGLLNGVCYIFLQVLFFIALEGHGSLVKEKFS